MLGFVEPVIKPFLKESKYRTLCQIGVSHGNDTDKLLKLRFVNISIIDPCLDEDLNAKYRVLKNVEILKGLSLEILPKIEKKFDCVLIDGDHNWYTVFNELNIIYERQMLNDGGAVLLHDVYWPYGRRDVYYLPDTIPQEFRHPYAKKGIVYGKSELSKEGGMNASHYNAVYENRPRNGVLTAVEDFLKEHEDEFKFFYFDIFRGLGVLVKKKNFWTKLIFLKWFFIAKFISIVKKIIRIFKSDFLMGIENKK